MASLRLEIQPKLTCPSCWKQLNPADLLWISSHPDLRGDPYLGTDALKRFLPSRFDVEGFALDANGLRCSALACPSCHLTLPRILVEILPTFVSVLGAPSSGKSYFLAASIWEARKKLGSFRITFTDADPVANQIVSGYEQKLFLSDKPDQIVAIPKTEQEGELYQLVNYGDRQELYARPFVFALRPASGHGILDRRQEIRTASRALCLYDNAGEHFQPTQESELSPATDHLALSEALIFVFDPLQHPHFRRLCRAHSTDPQLREEFRCYRQDEILLEAAKRIRQKANLAQHERFTRPLIVAVNKYDVWAGLLPDLHLEQVSPYGQDSRGANGLDLSVIERVSARVRQLLEQTSPEIVVACDSFCEDVVFVPVSPQGCSPELGDGQALGVRPKHLRPIWAEVPLLYAINRAKCSLVPTLRTGRRSDSARRTDEEEPPAPRLYTGTV